MKIIVIDISGKVPIYDVSLCEAIQERLGEKDSILFLCPLYDENPINKTRKFVNLVPKKYKNSEKIWKRLIKFLELLINYIILIYEIIKEQPNVIHFQWFPLLEITSLEYYVVKLMRVLSPQTKFILTIHNIYPHNNEPNKNRGYSRRFKHIARLLDSFIVHTEKTKSDVINEFGINRDIIKVVHHGIFAPKNFMPSHNSINANSISFILYGNLSHYKGVDVFVEAIKLLPLTYQKRIHCVIAGEIQDKNLCSQLQDRCTNLNIEFFPYFLPEDELYKRIDESNVIVLPYRTISQSGVLLLALYFKRFIITSDLPTFKETLQGFADDMFFESENPQSLANLMMRYVDGDVDFQRQMSAIERLNVTYSWEKAAEKTIRIYQEVIDNNKEYGK